MAELTARQTALPWAGPSAPPARKEGRGTARTARTDAASATVPPFALRWTLVALVVALICTGRLAIPGAGGYPLVLAMPLMYLLLVIMLLNGWLRVDPVALVLYAAVATLGTTSYMVNASMYGGNAPSASSLMLLLVLYLPFVFGLAPHPDGKSRWHWLMRTISTVLLVAALAGIAQFCAQFFIKAPWLFDISQLLPEALRAQGVFNSEIRVGTNFKANGFFFREPSGFSYMMAIGLLIEFILFRRWLRIACFVAALMLSYSGTGLLALAIGMVSPPRFKILLRLGLLGLTVVLFDVLAGDPLNLAFTLQRINEFGAPGSSAYMRYVAPMTLVNAGLESTPWTMWLGHGPGMILKVSSTFAAHDPTWAKLLFEYGLIGFLLMLGLFIYKMARADAPLQFKAVLFMSWLVMGGHLLIPDNVYFMYVVLGLWAMAIPRRREEVA